MTKVTIKKTNTYDGQDVEVYFNDVRVMLCTYLGESDEELTCLAKNFVRRKKEQQEESINYNPTQIVFK